MKKIVFSVGTAIPSADCETIPFESDRSLLDADIIIYRPTLGRYSVEKTYAGLPLVYDSYSAGIIRHLDHWRTELDSAASAGKLVVVFLTPLEEVYYYTGQQNFSGTGRSRITTNIVAQTSNYVAVPGLSSFASKSGERIRTTTNAGIISAYWKAFGSLSVYRLTIEGKFSRVLLETRGGEKTVGAIQIRKSSGAILFLPSLEFDQDAFRRKTPPYWTDAGLRFGARLLGSLVAIYDAVKTDNAATPPPTWVEEATYSIEAEERIREKLAATESKIANLQAKVRDLQGELPASRVIKGLLYEQGRPLEAAVHESLRLFGFRVARYHQDGSEFDVICESDEGRFLGEIEGKDSKAVNIDKLSQLERNLQEDFARDDVSQYAKGVLFGNAHRLSVPADRPDCFTAKCIEGAGRAKVALVRTPDMFFPARYLCEKQDSDYAQLCRCAILAADGAAVVFPAVPVGSSEADEVSQHPSGELT